MPLPFGYKPKENKETATATQCLEYQSVIGSLLYIMLGTRPDVFFAVIKMVQFSANPSQSIWMLQNTSLYISILHAL